jgi:hypothetical protein
VRRLPALAWWAALALAVVARAAFTAEPPAPLLPRVMAGELTRVDLARRSISIKTEGRDGREVDAATGPDTRFISRGRTLRLEDLRPGDRVVLALGDEGGRRLARVVKVVGRVALPAPSPSAASPVVPRAPAAPGSPG